MTRPSRPSAVPPGGAAEIVAVGTTSEEFTTPGCGAQEREFVAGWQVVARARHGNEGDPV